MPKMISLLFILLCGVRLHIASQVPSRSFLTQYDYATKTLPFQKFDILAKYIVDNCNKTIPLKIPRFTFQNTDIYHLYFCMGILESIERFNNDYINKNYKESLDTFFNRSSIHIMKDLRNYSSDICGNFSKIVLGNKSQWTEKLRLKFNQSEMCIDYCMKDDGVAADQCVFIYGIHKVIHLNELKIKSQTTQTSILTVSSKDTKIAPQSFNKNVPQNEESLGKNSESPAKNLKLSVKNQDSILETSATIGKTSEQLQNIAIPPKVDDLPNQPNFEKTISIDSQDGVEDTERFQLPISTSTTIKNIVKDPSSTTNKKPTQTQEVIPVPSIQKTEVDHIEDVKPKQQQQPPPPPPPPQIQDTDFNNEYEGNVDGDNKDDEDIDKDDDIVVPKNDHKNIRIDEEFSKRISSYGKKTIAAQEVDTEVSLMPWYLMVVFCAFLVYLSFANKKKIVAYVVEGRPNGRYGRRGGRPNTANYRKLDSNLEEAITSNCSTATSHVIY